MRGQRCVAPKNRPDLILHFSTRGPKHKNCDYTFNNRRNFNKFLWYAHLVSVTLVLNLRRYLWALLKSSTCLVLQIQLAPQYFKRRWMYAYINRSLQSTQSCRSATSQPHFSSPLKNLVYATPRLTLVLYKNHLHDHHRSVNKAIINIKSETLLTKFGLGEQDVGCLRSNYEINHKLNDHKLNG
jgi:hypothetical protein